MLTPEKFFDRVNLTPEVKKIKSHIEQYHTALLKSIIADLEANSNKNAVEYLKSKL